MVESSLGDRGHTIRRAPAPPYYLPKLVYRPVPQRSVLPELGGGFRQGDVADVLQYFGRSPFSPMRGS